MSLPQSAAGAVAHAWKLLDATARRRLGIELPQEEVLAAAGQVAQGSSWNPLEYLLAWDQFIEENRRLPPALAALGVEEAAR